MIGKKGVRNMGTIINTVSIIPNGGSGVIPDRQHMYLFLSYTERSLSALKL